MQRYFIEEAQVNENQILVKDQDFHHIKNVMRFRIGEKAVFICDNGFQYEAVLNSFQKEAAIFDIINSSLLSERRMNIHIAQALIKKDRFEWFLEKATEFDVDSITPVQFERSIIKIDEKEEEKKLKRYKTICKEASEQSEREYIPVLKAPCKLKNFDFSMYEHILVCYAREEQSHTLKEQLKQIKNTDQTLVLIGPEGGISPSELAFLETKGASFISLGKHIFRSESAGLFVLSAFRYEWEY